MCAAEEESGLFLEGLHPPVDFMPGLGIDKVVVANPLPLQKTGEGEAGPYSHGAEFSSLPLDPQDCSTTAPSSVPGGRNDTRAEL